MLEFGRRLGSGAERWQSASTGVEESTVVFTCRSPKAL